MPIIVPTYSRASFDELAALGWLRELRTRGQLSVQCTRCRRSWWRPLTPNAHATRRARSSAVWHVWHSHPDAWR